MITTGPDRALWFTLNCANAVGRIVPSGQLEIHPLLTPGAGPVGIHAGPTGVWFTEILAARVGHITRMDRSARPPCPTATRARTRCW
jgi:virginiamycin B lyase